MTNSSDYRLYLESCFKSLHIQIDSEFRVIHDRLEKIEIQTTKTNGRVTELEIGLIEHPVKCNQAKEIIDIKNDLEEYRMIKKYPKIAILIISILVFLSIYSSWQTMGVSKKVDDSERNIKKSIDLQEGVSKVTRGGYVKYNDLGLSDSIKVK